MSDTYSRRAFLTRAGASPEASTAQAASARQAAAEDASQATDEETVRLGFVGVGDRGSWHLGVALGIPGVEVPALCDIDDHYLYRAKRWVEEAGQPTPALYDRGEEDFKRLCQEEQLDAVICSTSWQWHVPVCLAAMRNGKNAVSEVPMVLTVDEAWELVETHEKTGQWATLGFKGVHSALSNMVYQGVFGDIRHAEAGYVHDLRLVKFDPEREPWRLGHSRDRNGNLYPDHPTTDVMPLMDINHGDRFKTITSLSAGSMMLNEYAGFYYGEDHPYATAEMAQGDYNVSLIRTEQGKMVTLNFDTNTPHPRGLTRVQGTKGVFMDGRELGGPRIYLDGVSPEEHAWEAADAYLEEYEHPVSKNYNPPERESLRGHGSNMNETPLEWHRLVTALREGRVTDFDVYDSVTSSVISPLSEQSVAKNGRPVEFPDFTRGKWKTRTPHEEAFADN